MRKYPKIGEVRDRRRKWAVQGPKCAVCTERAQYETHVQVNWFRGDDEVVKTCDAHKRDLETIVKTWESV